MKEPIHIPFSHAGKVHTKHGVSLINAFAILAIVVGITGIGVGVVKTEIGSALQIFLLIGSFVCIICSMPIMMWGMRTKKSINVSKSAIEINDDGLFVKCLPHVQAVGIGWKEIADVKNVRGYTAIYFHNIKTAKEKQKSHLWRSSFSDYLNPLAKKPAALYLPANVQMNQNQMSDLIRGMWLEHTQLGYKHEMDESIYMENKLMHSIDKYESYMAWPVAAIMLFFAIVLKEDLIALGLFAFTFLVCLVLIKLAWEMIKKRIPQYIMLSTKQLRVGYCTHRIRRRRIYEDKEVIDLNSIYSVDYIDNGMIIRLMDRHIVEIKHVLLDEAQRTIMKERFAPLTEKNKLSSKFLYKETHN